MNTLENSTNQNSLQSHYVAKSKGTWGREEAKTAEELKCLCNDFFEKLVVPKEWKFMGWNNVVDTQLGLLSVGKLFRDLRTNGIGLMHYRVFFMTFSTRGGICSKRFIDFGKEKKFCEVTNKTVEKLNEFIKEKYGEINVGESELTPPDEDGLQHFRDRFK